MDTPVSITSVPGRPLQLTAGCLAAMSVDEHARLFQVLPPPPPPSPSKHRQGQAWAGTNGLPSSCPSLHSFNALDCSCLVFGWLRTEGCVCLLFVIPTPCAHGEVSSPVEGDIGNWHAVSAVVKCYAASHSRCLHVGWMRRGASHFAALHSDSFLENR